MVAKVGVMSSVGCEPGDMIVSSIRSGPGKMALCIDRADRAERRLECYSAWDLDADRRLKSFIHL